MMIFYSEVILKYLREFFIKIKVCLFKMSLVLIWVEFFSEIYNI